MVGMFGIVAPKTGLLAIPQTSVASLQGIDHDCQAGIGGPWTMAGLTRDGYLGAQHRVIQVVEGGMAALAARVEILSLAQCGACTCMRVQGPGGEDGAMTSATRHAAHGGEPILRGPLRPRIE